MKLGEAAEAKGDTDTAARLYRTAAESDRTASDPALALARIELKQGQAESAANQYARVSAEHPDDWRALNGLGVARSQQGDAAQAQQAFAAALDKAPTDQQPIVRRNLAITQLLNGDYRQTIGLLEPLVTAHTATPDETKLLALAYGFVGRVEDAQRLGLREPPSPDLLRQLQGGGESQPRRSDTDS